MFVSFSQWWRIPLRLILLSVWREIVDSQKLCWYHLSEKQNCSPFLYIVCFCMLELELHLGWQKCVLTWCLSAEMVWSLQEVPHSTAMCKSCSHAGTLWLGHFTKFHPCFWCKSQLFHPKFALGKQIIYAFLSMFYGHRGDVSSSSVWISTLRLNLRWLLVLVQLNTSENKQ